MAGRSTNPNRDDPTWVSQSYFARLCGVTRTAIVQHVRSGKFRVAPNGMIDMESPEAQDYLASHRGPSDPALREPKKALPVVAPHRAETTPKPARPRQPAGDVAGGGGPTGEVQEPARVRGAYRGGAPVPGVGASKQDMQAWKLREEVVKLQLANARELNLTVGRELVERMIGVIDTALNRIIMDGRSNLIPQMVTMVRAGASVEDAQRWWADECGKFIGPVKPHLKKLLADHDRQRD